MAIEEKLNPLSLVAGENLSSRQYHFVKLLSGTDTIGLAGAVDRPIGVLQDDPTSGEVANFTTPYCKTPITLGETIAKGAAVACGANGRAVAAGSGDFIQGYILEGGNNGEVVTLLYSPQPEIV